MIPNQNWIGRTETASERLALSPAQRLAATLNHAGSFKADSVLPPLWHWLYWLPMTRLDESGADGHARRGGFLPPVDLPRRMWAGGRIAFYQPLRLGDYAVRESTITDVTAKQGKSGSLVFVTVRHSISGSNGLALVEDQELVYREAPKEGSATRAGDPAKQPDPQWSRTITPDPVLLFRYSALTFNSHRIHYDQPYCTEVEGYPGLVVHGPLIATLLADLLVAQTAAPLLNFQFRAVSPLFAPEPFQIAGRIDGQSAQLWALTPDGRLAMSASAALG